MRREARERGSRSADEYGCRGGRRELEARRVYAGQTLRRCEMADPVPSGSDASAGTYKCTNCGYELSVGSTDNLPPCPSCHNGQYETITGGDSINDPYPDRAS
jgi:rubrerythrin